MNREHVLAAILVLSLCTNIYLISADHSTLDREIRGVVHRALLLPDPVPFNNTSVSGDGVESYNLTGTEPDNSSFINGEPFVPEETPVVTPETTLPTPVPTSDGWTNYSSKKYAFSLKYPVTWDLNDGSTGSPGRLLVLTAPPETECDSVNAQCFKYLATLTIDIDQNPQTLSLEEYFNSAVAALQRDYGITSTSKSALCIVSGTRAYRIDFYTRDERGNPDRSYMQYYTLIDKKGYIISYTGPFSNWENVFSTNKGDAQRIIDSFEVERIFEVV